ncbi:MAG: AAA family ATPase [Lentisphaerae bacterium GWF2_44_16]|nr:MAG: AAA family ATPase [Lentisphaerae bacterium GWF2_44_16]
MGAMHYLLDVGILPEENISVDEYPYSLPVCRHLLHNTIEFHPQVTFFIGENGAGKSTFLEALATATGFNPEGGSINFNFSTRSSHSSLYENLVLNKGVRRPKDGFFLRAESFFNVATEIERMDAIPAGAPPVINSYGGNSLHEQSHGESFMTLLTERFRGNGLYILDEPEAALSPNRQMALLAGMHSLVRNNSQFIIATHSPIIMAYPHAVIYHLSDDGVSAVKYTDTEHYIVSRNFLNKHEAMIKELLQE